MDIELGSVIGYRAWVFDVRERLPVLTSPYDFYRTQWPYGTLEAKCGQAPRLMAGKPEHSADSVPNINCECGIYASSDPLFKLQARRKIRAALYGEVELFGRVIIHEHGYRAQYARVSDIYDYLYCDHCGEKVNMAGGYVIPCVRLGPLSLTPIGVVCDECVYMAKVDYRGFLPYYTMLPNEMQDWCRKLKKLYIEEE